MRTIEEVAKIAFSMGIDRIWTVNSIVAAGLMLEQWQASEKEAVETEIRNLCEKHRI